MEAISGYLTYVVSYEGILKLYLTKDKFEIDKDGGCTVWGDDWDDAPYEHNAGEPYNRHTILILDDYYGACKVPRSDYFNSPHSVLSINRDGVPWISSSNNQESRLLPNSTFEDIVKFARDNRIDIYTKMEVTKE